jgi:hypothetical protein
MAAMRNPYLCLAIVVGLIVTALSGTWGMVLVALNATDGPALLPALVALGATVTTCLGSLSSFLVNVPRGSVGGPPKPDEKEGANNGMARGG